MSRRFLTFFTFAGEHMRSLGGWTPGLRTIVRGRSLPCGCLAGVYETCSSELAEVIDSADPRCEDPSHREHWVLWRRSRQAPALVDADAELPQFLH